MEKVIKIGKQEVKLSNNVAWTMEYRDQFGKDIVPSIMPILATAMETMATMVGDRKEIELSEVMASLEGRAMEILLPMFQVEFVDIVINVLWAMAKAADETIDPPKRWVRQFETFPLDIVMPTIFDMVLKGFISSKNLKRLETVKKNLKGLQPSISTTSSLQESKEG